MSLIIIAGARHNFLKIASIIHALQNNLIAKIHIKYRLIHTGQHYDKNMSGDFFLNWEFPIQI
jgi:UDP-N-acetylglucosamine 2-epimerase (non-hydrolysing)